MHHGDVAALRSHLHSPGLADVDLMRRGLLVGEFGAGFGGFLSDAAGD